MGKHRASSAGRRRAALVLASLLLGLVAWQTSVAAVTEDADLTPALEVPSRARREAPIEAGVAADAPTPLLPIGVDDLRTGGGSTPAGAGNEACASALTVRLAGEDAVVLGRTCAAANEDGSSQGDATTLALFGNEIVGASSHSEEGPLSDRTDPLSPLCEGSSGAVCLQVLYAESSSSEDGGAAESHAALLFICLGGSNPAPKAECDGLVQLAIGESHSGTTSDETTGAATADAESQLVDLCLGGEDPETGLCTGIGIGVAQAESHSDAPSPDEPGTTSGSSRPLSLEAGGEDVLGLTDPAAVEPLCPTVFCLFFNQEESAESEGSATGRQDVFLADLLGSPGTAEADAGTQTSATNPGTAPAPPRPRPRPAPQPAPPPRPGPAPAPVREAQPREPPPEREEPLVTPTPSPTPQPEAPDTGALAAPLLPTDPHRSQFVRSLPSPFGVDWLSGRTLLNLGLAMAAIPLLLFPGQIFSSTFEENYEEIRGWFRPFRRLSKGPGAMAARTQRRRGGLLFLSLLIAFLYGFLSPDFGWNRASAALLLGVVGTIFLALVFAEIISALYLQRRVNDRFTLALYPWSIVIALVCIGVSRLADFNPGYLYVSVAAATFAATLSTELEGKGAAVANVALLLGGLAAWFVWTPVRTAAEAADAGFWILVLDAILAATFIGALETVMFNLLPMRFMDGEKVLKWKKWVWAALFAASLFLFLHVLLKPGTGYIGTTDTIPFITIVALFVGFGLFSIAFWAYFRFRKPRAEGSQPEPTQAGATQAKPKKKKVPAGRS